MAKNDRPCEWTTLDDAITAFFEARDGHQGQRHIKPVHWYAACRLVIEGGFNPDEITPRPPFVIRRKSRGGKAGLLLEFDPKTGGTGEQIVLGGLKTKNVDVVVSKAGIGPCVAVSVKGTLNAFRNLTNRMEEAIGDCTNLHFTYPALVYGFAHFLRVNREGPLPKGAPSFLEADEDGQVKANDVSVAASGKPADSILRYREVMLRLAGRSDIRQEPSRYEAVALALVERTSSGRSQVVAFPPNAEALDLDEFFQRLYRQYEIRFVYAAPLLAERGDTTRLEWDPDSPILKDPRAKGFNPRISGR